MNIECNTLTASDGIQGKTYFFSAGSTLLFLQQREDGWYHWRDDSAGKSAVRLRTIKPDASIVLVAKKALGMLEQHLEVSLQMVKNRKQDFMDGVNIEERYKK